MTSVPHTAGLVLPQETDRDTLTSTLPQFHTSNTEASCNSRSFPRGAGARVFYHRLFLRVPHIQQTDATTRASDFISLRSLLILYH